MTRVYYRPIYFRGRLTTDELQEFNDKESYSNKSYMFHVNCGVGHLDNGT